VARALLEKGYPLVRPLSGGLEGWVSAGYPVEEMLPDQLRSA
jgi:rhodanese-related sulfurtransferase